MVKAANEANSERLKKITARLISNLMCDYKLVHSVVDNMGVKVLQPSPRVNASDDFLLL